eukprot:gene6036-16027_t
MRLMTNKKFRPELLRKGRTVTTERNASAPMCARRIQYWWRQKHMTRFQEKDKDNLSYAANLYEDFTTHHGDGKLSPRQRTAK